MKETEWEASRTTHWKRLRIILYVCVPICALAGIIFYNNRDQFASGTEHKEMSLARDVEQKSDSIIKNVKEHAEVQSVKVQRVTAAADSKEVVQAIMQKKIADTLNAKKEIAAEKLLYSEIIPNIPCQIDSKKGIIITISVELFYKDESKRAEILLRRNEIKVAVQKLIRYKEIGDIKKEIIGPELTNAISGIFERNTLNKLEIRDMQIEKVYKP